LFEKAIQSEQKTFQLHRLSSTGLGVVWLTL